MMRYHKIMTLLVNIILLFTLASCGSGESDASREGKIRALVQASIDSQYEHKTEDLGSVYTKEFSSDFPEYYYKDDLGPCKITNYDFMTTLTETDDGELVVAVRVEDKQGSYIQIIHITKDKTNYLINYIEYDI